MQLCRPQPVDRRSAIEAAQRAALRNQKFRRIHHYSIVDRKRTTKRSLNSNTQTKRMYPMRAQVFGVDSRKHIAGRHRRLILAKQITNSPEYIATVIEWHDLQRVRYRHARLQVHYGQRVAAHGNRKRIQEDRILIFIEESAFRDDHFPWASFFK